MKLLIISLILCATFNLSGQVGIGTTSPNSILDIESPSDDLPVLELNPQTAPVGTAMGQLSVIDDRMYLYDDTREKWLSLESSTFNFGREGDSDNINLEYAGDIDRNGPRMPFNGTIVYATMNSTGGVSDKSVSVNITDSFGVTTSHNFALVSGSILMDDLNIDIQAGDSIIINVSGDDSAVENLSAVLWIKWRK